MRQTGNGHDQLGTKELETIPLFFFFWDNRSCLTEQCCYSPEVVFKPPGMIVSDSERREKQCKCLVEMWIVYKLQKLIETKNEVLPQAKDNQRKSEGLMFGSRKAVKECRNWPQANYQAR